MALRYLYCLIPYGSPPPVVTRLPQAPLSQNTNSVTFARGRLHCCWGSRQFLEQVKSFHQRAATVAGKIIPGSVWFLAVVITYRQFYIVAYGFRQVSSATVVLDRFPIGAQYIYICMVPQQGKYTGIHNVAQFELSFGIACSENYHGPQCNVFRMEVPGQFTCNNDGTMMYVNDGFSPESNCTQCRVPGRGPQNNCAIASSPRLPSTQLHGGCGC